MKKIGLFRWIATIIVVFIVIGCARVKYTPLSSMSYPATNSVKVYWEKPDIPYTELGVITAESSDSSQEKLIEMLKEKAMSVGAQGIIMRSATQRTRTFPTPVAPGTTLTPTKTTLGLGAIAIRFSEQSTSPEAKPPAPKVGLPPKAEAIPPEKPMTPIQATPAPEKNKITIIGTFANVRSGAGDEFSIVTIVKQGEKLILLGEYGEWYHVRLENGQEGWVKSRFVK